MGEACSNPHAKSKEEDQAIPVVGLDYAYMESNTSDRGMPMLVMNDRETKGVFANVVPEKGLNQHAVKRVCKDRIAGT